MIRAWVDAHEGSWLGRAPGVSASLAQVGSVRWPVVAQIDETYGGLSLYVGERELWVGLDSALEMPFFRRELEGRPHVMVGSFTPLCWYVDERGALLEVELTSGVIVSRAESLEAMLERVAQAHPK